MLLKGITRGYHYHRLKDTADLKRFIQLSESKGIYRPRGDELENDETFGQLIMYGYHIRPDGKFFLYQRGQIGNYDEARLAGQVSVGVGGHMERTDLSVAGSFKRELGEEVSGRLGDQTIFYAHEMNGKVIADLAAVKAAFYIQPRGILRDVRRLVDSVHIGVVTRLLPRDPNLQLQILENGENVASKYVSLDEYHQIATSQEASPEMWTDAVVREEIEPLINSSKHTIR